MTVGKVRLTVVVFLLLLTAVVGVATQAGAAPALAATREATATPRPTREATPAPDPTVEPTAEPTGEATPTNEPPPGGECGDHDPTAWHEPGCFHHHGADPSTAHPLLVEAMETYWTQEIGSPWVSSHHENMFPEGAHAGFKNLVETDIACPFYKPVDGDLCVNAYLLQIHALGTQAHGLVPVHSWKAAVLVCDSPEINQDCGVVLSGGWHDYGQFHAPYKKYLCIGPGSLIVPESRSFITPYVALGTDKLSLGYNRIFWNSQRSVVMDQYFLAQRGYIPNRGMTIAWAEMDAWDMVPGSSPECADPSAHVDSAKPGDNGTLFQVYDMRYQLPSARPFTGYTDRHGVIRPAGACNEQGLDCVPLYISENAPQGRLRLNRNVGPSHAPFLEFENGAPLKPPPFSLSD